jgi:hypothetical protein
LVVCYLSDWWTGFARSRGWLGGLGARALLHACFMRWSDWCSRLPLMIDVVAPPQIKAQRAASEDHMRDKGDLVKMTKERDAGARRGWWAVAAARRMRWR